MLVFILNNTKCIHVTVTVEMNFFILKSGIFCKHRHRCLSKQKKIIAVF